MTIYDFLVKMQDAGIAGITEVTSHGTSFDISNDITHPERHNLPTASNGGNITISSLTGIYDSYTTRLMRVVRILRDKKNVDLAADLRTVSLSVDPKNTATYIVRTPDGVHVHYITIKEYEHYKAQGV